MTNVKCQREEMPEFLFICGASRTGTTLVQQILDEHKEISMPFELGITRMWRIIFSEMGATGTGETREQKYSPFKFNGEDLDLVRKLHEQAFVKILIDYNKTRKPNAIIIGEKQPTITLYMDWIRKHFNCKFIMCWRDLEETIQSNIKASVYGEEDCRESIKTYFRIMNEQKDREDVYVFDLNKCQQGEHKRIFQEIADFIGVKNTFDLSIVNTKTAGKFLNRS